MEPKSAIDKQKWVDLADQAFFRLKEIIDLSPTEDPKLLKAVETAFDRAYGKPTQPTEVTIVTLDPIKKAIADKLVDEYLHKTNPQE